MPFDAARWQILLAAQDMTAAAFNSLQQRMRQTQIVADGVTAGMNAALVGVTRILGPLSAAYLATAAAQKVWAAGMKAADMGEQAEQIGLTTDLLQAYRLEAAQNGVSVEQLDGAMMKLTRAMGEANGGSDEAIAKFEKLGVKLLDANGTLRKSSDVLPEVARGLLNMGSETERNAAMMEIFGRSGSRMVTILKALADGNQELVNKARNANALMSEDTIKVWDEVGNRMAVAHQRSEALWAQLSAPIAAVGLQTVNNWLVVIEANLKAVGKAGDWLFSSKSIGGNLENMQAEAEKLKKSIDAAEGKNLGTTAKARLEQEKARLGVLQREIAAQAADAEKKITDKINRAVGKPAEPPPPFMKQPEGKAAKADTGKSSGDSAQKKLDALIVERQALEDALSRFEVKGNETVAEMEKRLDRAVALQKKVASLTEGLPKDSPLAQQMTAEATAIADLNQKLEDKRKLMQGAEQTIAKYGDGSKEAARAIEDLNAQLAAGLITQQQHAAAVRASTQAQQEQAITARGSAEGFDAFVAGMDHIINQSSRMSRSFQYGEKTMQLLDDAISQMVENGQVNFDKLLGSFLMMIAQMEARAAVSTIWGMLGGSTSGGGGGIASALIGGLSSIVGGAFGSAFGGPSLSTLQGGIGPGGQVLLFADGGRPPVGRASIVGEAGPELFVPDGPGTILNQEQVAGLGGGTTVIVQQTVHVGEFVTTSQYAAGLRAVEQSARQGAMAGIINQRKRGGLKDVFN